MLFNSYGFIFLYLPAALLGFFQLARVGPGIAAAWLALTSVFFYGWWNPTFVFLLLGSIFCNFGFSLALNHVDSWHKKLLLSCSISANLAVLAYYKYANFFLENLGQLSGSQFSLGEIILPLGISFFTFTQIAFLVDTYQGKVHEHNFVHYLLFVTYFPHLIAGPVLHHKEMMPQFGQPATYRFNYENIAVGATIFFIGLFKKVILADGVAVYVGPVFSAAEANTSLTFIEAWSGAICYSLQLYFDFSGYSDMAIGLSRLFGIRLPLNFHSPYKAVSIIDFWRRWHMTLSRFLRDYLYIPLGGNRYGTTRRQINLLVTMLLGGLWHGAGWTFIVWGGLHGIFLVINHGWHTLCSRITNGASSYSHWLRPIYVLTTFLAVTFAWVFFRAESLDHALRITSAMLGTNGLILPDTWLIKWGGLGAWLQECGAKFGPSNNLIGSGALNWIWISMLIVWLAPNTQEIMQRFRPALEVPSLQPTRISWQPSSIWALVIWLIGFIAIINLNKQSAFLYFQF